MKHKIFLLIVLITLSFLSNSYIFATEKGLLEEKETYNNTFNIEKRLNLTKEQTEKLQKIREKYFADMQRLRSEIFQKNIELKNLYLDSKASESNILSKQRELKELRQKLEEKRTEMMLEERKILTPEQLETLNQFPMEKRYNRMNQNRGKFRRGIMQPRF